MTGRGTDRTRIVVEIALTMALAAILNSLKLWRMPQAGAVSLVLLPLVVLSLRRGLVVGVIAGMLYGIVDAIIDPFVVHPVQFLLDYPVAYGLTGLAGLFAPAWRTAASRGAWALGIWTAVLPAALVATLGKYAAHVLSGVVYFSEYAAGQPVLLYSLAYNSTVIPSGLMAFATAAVVMPALSRALDGAPSAREKG